MSGAGVAQMGDYRLVGEGGGGHLASEPAQSAEAPAGRQRNLRGSSNHHGSSAQIPEGASLATSRSAGQGAHGPWLHIHRRQPCPEDLLTLGRAQQQLQE
jgi:hypothetical protein